MRILYCGLPLGAIYLERSGFPVEFAVVAPRNALGLWRLRRKGSGKPLILSVPNLADSKVTKLLLGAQPDVLLSWFYPQRIPTMYLNLPLGAWGAHPSLLPRWRGPDPYFWTLREGDSKTGVTLHRLVDDYDRGAIALQRETTVLPHENAWDLAKRLDKIALDLLIEGATRLSKDGYLRAAPQDERDASFAPFPTAEILHIDWHQSSESIERLIRAAAPYPGAVARLGSTDAIVLRAHVRPLDSKLRAVHIGEAVLTAEGPSVRTLDSALCLTAARLESGARIVGEKICDLL